MSGHPGDPQLGFRFRVVYADGRQEQILVDADRALIGSASHCELRLPPEVAAHEHVEVFAHEGAVHFATRPYALLALPALDGVATVEGRWQTGSALRIANVQLYVELVSLGMAKAKPPLWALFIAIPAIVITAVGVALARPIDRGLPPIPEAPAIVAAKDAKCPDLSQEQRAVLATERMRIALAKRERSPFAPQDGIEAISLFEVSAVCFRAAAMPQQATEADDAANDLRVKLDEEYRLRRVRLEHAYRTHQTGAVKRELAVLIPMTSHRRGPYTEWLAALDRAATAELEQRGRLAP
ncbi:MAG: uncharacterized protein JWP87_3220 [Labilithrix sp.]|nr:uncharacterized protein [Labilithrix sp.]